MSLLRCLPLLIVVLALVVPEVNGQGKLTQDLAGKWQPVDEDKLKIVVEFTRNGLLRIVIDERQIEGTYRVISDNEIEVSLTLEDKKLTEKLSVSINGDQMVTVDSKGKKDVFRRIQ
ncbi:MAG: hypothetical protein NZM42_10990 [Gemmatales bacterium]|nr:hypothetical protein [Gemmatales bacterium]MDW8221550.1 hypothetical protein [Gemmatales bacterium]